MALDLRRRVELAQLAYERALDILAEAEALEVLGRARDAQARRDAAELARRQVPRVLSTCPCASAP